MTTMEKVIMALLVTTIVLFAILLATDNVQIIIVVGEKIKTGVQKVDWRKVADVTKQILN